MTRIHARIVGIAACLGALVLAGPALGKSPAPPRAAADEEFEEATDALPPGMKERVFIHLPRTHRDDHLGTCTETIDAGVNDYGLAGWQLPADGITWYVNVETIPPAVGVAAAVDALKAAFATWTDADPHKKFVFGGATGLHRPRLDFVNSVLWGRVSRGAIGITYVRYHAATGVVADVEPRRV